VTLRLPTEETRHATTRGHLFLAGDAPSTSGRRSTPCHTSRRDVDPDAPERFLALCLVTPAPRAPRGVRSGVCARLGMRPSLLVMPDTGARRAGCARECARVVDRLETRC